MPNQNTPTRSRLQSRIAAGALALCLGCQALAADMRVDVDATDIPRRLLRAKLTIPANPGETTLRYVEWTPGNHNPSGPIQNVVEFRAQTESGEPLTWRRDRFSDTRITIADVPSGAERIVVSLTYITNQPTTNSRSTDSYGQPNLGGISWNTVLFYPEDADKDELMIDASITLPEGWSIATPLPLSGERGGTFEYDGVTLAQLVDCPAIFGEHLARVDLSTGEIPRHTLCGVAASPDLLHLPEARAEKLRFMHEQAAKVFGPFPGDRFDYLMFVCDEIPGFGVEHNTCTYFAEPDNEWVDSETPGGPDMGTMVHEYIHAWNGKLRAPEGLLSRNFHEPAVTDLLWVYEGLTSYMDDVLLARSGLVTRDEYHNIVTNNIMRYQLQTGRLWRPVVDTARGMKRLRTRSDAWEELRRRQDYYGEGALFWMAADATIRADTGGQRSLDDFCRRFFDTPWRSFGDPTTYTRADVVEALTAVDPGADWDAMIRQRIESPAETLALDVPGLLGYRMEFTDEPTELQAKADKKNKGLDLRTSLGFSVDEKGVITTVLKDSAADDAKLAYDMVVVGVGDEEFTPETLRQAVAASSTTGEVRLLVKFGGKLYARSLLDGGGLRYPRLTPIDGAEDILGAIITPR
ncbi:MAG: M61 family metallopeptidase [Phycisphaeraceae bacterium]|nr:M61 family metallopeptidase [Phycisphaeraceae bacterium]MCB9847755.1 M61 family metallopeptidase [Phycisphaeraceae bacterium]